MIIYGPSTMHTWSLGKVPSYHCLNQWRIYHSIFILNRILQPSYPNAFYYYVSEFSLEALVGKWHHNRGATVTCTRFSNTQVNCQLFGSINGSREIIWGGSKYTYAGHDMDAPTIKQNSFGDREIDWDNGVKWSEFGKFRNYLYSYWCL